jgi:SAM-dependent methyltransferase
MQNQQNGNEVTSPVTGGICDFERMLDSATIVRRYAEIALEVGQYYEGRSQVPIYRCRDTGYRFFHPPALAGEADFYEQLHSINAKVPDADHEYRNWSEDFEYAFERIVPGESLLDVGCGNGAFLRRAADKADVLGIDGSSFAQRHCQRLGLDVRLGTLADHADEFVGRFDTVTGFQILEHIYDVRSFLNNIVKVVRPGGRVVLAVPNNEPFVRRFDPYTPLNCPPHHIGLWNRVSLEAMAGHFGLVPTEHRYCEVSGRWSVEAYLRARLMLGITSDIHKHSLREMIGMLALAPYTVPLSLIQHWRTGGLGTRNVIVMSFQKRPAKG